MTSLGAAKLGGLKSVLVPGAAIAGCLILLLHLALKLADWCRIYWHLRKLPSPTKQYPFSLSLDMWQKMALMDPGLKVPASKSAFSFLIFGRAGRQTLHSGRPSVVSCANV